MSTDIDLTTEELAFWIIQGQANAPQVIKALLSAYGAQVLLLCRAVLTDQADEELVHTALLSSLATALREPRTLGDFERIEDWLFSVTVKTCQALERQLRLQEFFGFSRRVRKPMRTHTSRLEAMTGHEQEVKLTDELRALAARDRILMLLRYRFSRGIPEIARILDTTEQNIFERLFEIRDHLIGTVKAVHRSRKTRHYRRSIQAQSDQPVAVPIDPSLTDHLEVCDHCRDYLARYSRLETQLNRTMEADWAMPALSHAEIDGLTPQVQARWQQNKKNAPGALPVKEIFWIVIASILFLAVFRNLSPYIALLSETATPEVSPSPTVARWILDAPDASPSASQNGTIQLGQLFDRAEKDGLNWRLVRTFVGGTSKVNSVAYSSDGKYLAVGSSDNQVRVWGFFEESRFYLLDAHAGPVTVVRFSPGGERLLTGGQDGSIRVWESGFRQQPLELDEHPGPIQMVDFSADGALLAVATMERLWLWEILENAFVRFYEYGGDKISSISFAPSGEALAIADDDAIMLMSTVDGAVIPVFQNQEGAVQRVSFSADARWIASASGGKTVNLVELVDTPDGLIKGHIDHRFAHPDDVVDISFSPDGAVLATTTQSASAYLWSVEHGGLLDIIPGAGLGVAFSPDGSTLVTFGNEGSIHLWMPESIDQAR